MDEGTSTGLPALRAAPFVVGLLAAATSALALGTAPAAATRAAAPTARLLEALGPEAGSAVLASTAAEAAALDGADAPTPSRVRVGLRLRPVGGSQARTLADATRLAPLPSSDLPVAVLLGPLEGSRRAAFLIADRATTWGEGTCAGPGSGCHVLELGVGQTELIDVPAPAGSLRRYALTVTSLGEVRDASPETTLHRERHRSAAGVRIIRRAIRERVPGLGAYRWSARDGIVRTSGGGLPAQG